MPQTNDWHGQVLKITNKLQEIEVSSEAPDRLAIVALHFDLDLLEYMITPKSGWIAGPEPTVGNPICSEPGCKADWKSGLLNHAAPGFNPVWYCEKHLKPVKNQHIIGTPEKKREVLLKEAKEMAGRWTAFGLALESETQVPPDLKPWFSDRE